MKKVNVVLSSMMIAFSSISLADISVTDTQNGAWVTVTENGNQYSSYAFHGEHKR